MSDKKTKFEDIFSFKDYSDPNGDWNYEKICEEADKYAELKKKELKKQADRMAEALREWYAIDMGLISQLKTTPQERREMTIKALDDYTKSK